MTTTRSASANASSWSWVTNSVGERRARTNSARSSATRRSRSSRSSEPSGSSSMSSRGSGARARASATRCCSPPESSRDAPVLEAGEPDQRERGARAASSTSARGQPLHAQPEGHVAEHVAVREQRVVLEHEAEAAPVRRDAGEVVAVPARRVPARRRSSPATARSSVLLPLPLGPEHAHDLAVGHRRGRRRRARRCRRSGRVSSRRARASQNSPTVARRGSARWRGRRPRSAPSGSCSRPSPAPKLSGPGWPSRR